jgi:hypothetical protein
VVKKFHRNEIFVAQGFNPGDKKKKKKNRPRERDSKRESGISDGTEINIEKEI